MFLSRVAAAVRAGNKHREEAADQLPETVGYLSAGDDPVGRLVEELARVGASAVRVRTREDVTAATRSVVERFSVRTAILNGSKVLDDAGVNGILSELGVDVVTAGQLAEMDESARRDRCFAADLGVAAPDWSVAETGTLVYAAAPEQLRSSSLLPPVHLAIVDGASVLADLMNLPQRIAGQSVQGVLPRNVAMVTGPSKTGDIELKLTTGVHGPCEVHVIVWDRESIDS